MSERNEQEIRQNCKRPVMTEAEELRLIKAEQIVRRHVFYSMGLGLIPIPLVDTGGVSLIQLKMLHSLSKHYQVPFFRNVVKSLIASLLGFISGNAVARGVLPSVIKIIPGAQWVGMASMSVFSGASTYAIGSIFVQHFESGGNFLNFKPEKAKSHFSRLYQDGKVLVKEMKNKELS